MRVEFGVMETRFTFHWWWRRTSAVSAALRSTLAASLRSMIFAQHYRRLAHFALSQIRIFRKARLLCRWSNTPPKTERHDTRCWVAVPAMRLHRLDAGRCIFHIHGPHSWDLPQVMGCEDGACCPLGRHGHYKRRWTRIRRHCDSNRGTPKFDICQIISAAECRL